MKVLAIDASTKSTGVALFDDKKLVKYDCLTASSTDLIKRIQIIVRQLNDFIKNETIERVILEEVRPESGSTIVQSMKTQRALMWLQAAIAFLLHETNPKAEIEYTYPSSWRSKCGIKNGRGYRRESVKQADILFVKENYGIDVNDDIADAIGIGHAYVHDLSDEVNW